MSPEHFPPTVPHSPPDGLVPDEATWIAGDEAGTAGAAEAGWEAGCGAGAGAGATTGAGDGAGAGAGLFVDEDC